MWTLCASLELFALCQVVSMNFGPGHIFLCQHSHAPHPESPPPGKKRETVREKEGRWEEGCLCFITQVIWQLRYLSLLFFTLGLAPTQDQTSHTHIAYRDALRKCIIISPNYLDFTEVSSNGLNTRNIDQHANLKCSLTFVTFNVM